MARVVVAGGTGFIGRAVTRELARRGAEVAVLTRNPAKAARLGLPAEAVEGDVRRPAALSAALSGADAAVLAVQFPGYPVESPARGRTFMEIDARGTAALATAAREAGVRRLVYVSGVGADPEAPQPWYRAKGLAEASVRDSGLAHVIVRPSWVYGPEDRSMNHFVDLLRLIPFFFPQLGPGTGRITPIHIDDLAGLACDATLGPDGDGPGLADHGLVVEAGGPDVLTLDEVVRAAMRVIGREKSIVHIPLWLVKAGAAVLERLPGQLLSRSAVDFITQDGIADAESASEAFPGFRPRPLEEGLASYL